MVNNECSEVPDNEHDNSSGNGLSSCPICQNPADKKCSACHAVSYCSAEHQKRHWRSHKRTCRSYTVKRNETFGRYLVATRDIPQGTTIFTEEPLIIGPKRCTYPVCLGCHKRVHDGCYRCSKCTYPMCSEECGKVPIHAENECVIFQRATHPVGSKISNFDSVCPAYECILPLRCLLFREQNPSKWERLTSMEHHNEVRKAVPGLWNRNHNNVVKLLLEWYKMKHLLYDEDSVHSVMGYIDVNSFEIKYSDIEMCGVYPNASLMAHDCVPNTHHAISVSSDHKMTIRSSIPVKKGEMITTSYVSQWRGTRLRRHALKDSKYFDCICQRCQDPSEFATYISAIKCPDCATGYQLPKDPLRVHSTDWACSNVKGSHQKTNGCSRCTKTMKDEQVENILRKASKDIDEVSCSTAGSQVSRLERLLKKYSGKVFHPNHYLLLSVIRNLNYAYAKINGGWEGGIKGHDDGAADGKEELDMDRLTRSKSLCLQLLSVLDMIDPGLTRLRGVTLFQMSLSDFQISKIKLQKNESSREEYNETLSTILTYLQTGKEIMELDKVVTPNAFLYDGILEQIDIIQEALDSQA